MSVERALTLKRFFFCFISFWTEERERERERRREGEREREIE